MKNCGRDQPPNLPVPDRVRVVDSHLDYNLRLDFQQTAISIETQHALRNEDPQIGQQHKRCEGESLEDGAAHEADHIPIVLILGVL